VLFRNQCTDHASRYESAITLPFARTRGAAA
jgi:hypothetical protein